MFEVELKFRRPQPDHVAERLTALGCRPLGEVRQVDAYFGHPARDFGRTGETVRLRDVAGRATLTYKGPLVDDASKTRREIEIDLAGSTVGGTMTDWLRAVGFRPVLQVVKSRRAWTLSRAGRDVEIALDDVDGLGAFVELETRADEAELPAARAVLQQLAAELDLTDAERRGYLTMLRDRAAGTS